MCVSVNLNNCSPFLEQKPTLCVCVCLLGEYIHLLHFAWANQRRYPFCIERTGRNIKGQCCMSQSRSRSRNTARGAAECCIEFLDHAPCDVCCITRKP